MTERKQHAKGPAPAAPDAFRSLLVPVDLSPGSDRVVDRVPQLPLADNARVTLLHVLPKKLEGRARARAERDVHKLLDAEAKDLRACLRKRVTVHVVVTSGAPAAEIAKTVSSVKAELVVMGRGSGRPLRDVFLGSTAERVIRRGQVPVLVVRLRPRAPYARPALAVDIEQGADESLAMLLRLIPSPRPLVTVIHAFDVPYLRLSRRANMVPDDEDEYRDEYRLKALREIARVLATSLARAEVPPAEAPSWKTHLRDETPRSVIEKAVKKADVDLLVLGTRGYTGVTHAFLGTVSGDVLRRVACDVLVVPLRANDRER